MSNEIIKIISQCGFLSTAPGVAQITDANGNWGPLSAAASILIAQTRFVAKDGNDATGDGSLGKPFLTIQAAITSITDASAAKTYSVFIWPGTFTETFQLTPFVYIHGVDQSSVILNPVTANWITAAFAAGTQDTGIENCTLKSAFVCNFATVASLGAATIQLRKITMGVGSSIAITGNNVSNAANLQGVESIAATTSLTLSNIQSIIDGIFLRNGNLAFNGNDNYATVHRCGSLSTGGTVSVISTGVTNALIVAVENPGFLQNPTITGIQSQLSAPGYRVQGVAPDANTTFSFGNTPNAVGATNFPCAGDMYLTATPTGQRTYTFERGDGGASTPTSVTIKNLGSVSLLIAYAAGASGSAKSQTYIPPGETVKLYNVGSVWQVSSYVQRFSVSLTNGVSAAIPADISADTAFSGPTLTLWNGAQGVGAVMLADRVNGTVQAGTGSFKVRSIVQASGATLATDQGTYEVHATGF